MKTILDDILIATLTSEEHERVLSKVFSILHSNEIRVNFKKSVFFKKRIVYLGNIIEGGTVRANLDEFNSTKIRRIPKTKKELSAVLGYINWYRPYLPRLSELAGPLYEKLKLRNFSWNQTDREIIKRIEEEIYKEQTLHFPDLSKPYDLHTDACLSAISGILTQEGKIIRIFSAKLSESQQKWNIVEKELFAVISAVKNFHQLIWGCEVNIYTDNRNLLFDKNIHANRAQRWKLILSEYRLVWRHVEGKRNSGADFLSRNFWTKTEEPFFDISKLSLDHEEKKEGDEKREREDGEDVGERKIKVPSELILNFLEKFHDHFGHPGVNKTLETLRPFYEITGLRPRVEELIRSCVSCQKAKHYGIKRGLISGFFVPTAPRESVSSDIWGHIEGENYKESGKFYIISFTDTFSRYTLLVATRKIRGEDVLEAFKNSWVRLFGIPQTFLSDQGRQYTSEAFNLWLSENGIKRYFSTRFNPTGNSLSERLNTPLAHVFRMGVGEPLEQVRSKAERFLNQTVNSTLGYTPAEIMGVKTEVDLRGRERIIDLERVRDRIIEKAEQNNFRVNAQRMTEEEFEVGDSVFVKNFIRHKMEDFWLGPFLVLAVAEKKNSCLVQGDSSESWENVKNLKLFRKAEKERE